MYERGFEDEKIKDFETILDKKLSNHGVKIILDSYIISEIPLKDVQPIFKTNSIETYATHHIVFKEHGVKCIGMMLDDKLMGLRYKMIPNTIIDENFIEKWHPRYDQSDIGGDYIEYKQIVEKVSDDISSQGTISKSTFYDIINWKSARTKGKLRSDYTYYADAFRKVLAAPENKKLPILVELDGIGVPVGSTILHFIYPLVYPIMDVRVTDVLYNFGYLKAKIRSINNYSKYHIVILDINPQPKCLLRKVD